MHSSDVRKQVTQLKRELGTIQIDYKLLRSAVETQGYTVIEFNHIYNDEAVQQLIDALRVEQYISSAKGFTYADRNYRLVFVHEDLTEKEKILVLAHEAGHIYLEHLSTATIIGKDVQEEHEANEFAHFLLHHSFGEKVSFAVKRNRKWIIGIAAALLLCVIICIVLFSRDTKKSYHGEYYLTETGNRYHEKECIFVKDKNNVHRMTEEEFISGEYEPCQTCLPK